MGGRRDEANFRHLDPDLSNWIEISESYIVYVSLGTLATVEKTAMKTFIERVKHQNTFRVLWL